MAIASFSSKVFEVNSDKIYTFDGFQYTSSLSTEKQEAHQKKPATYIKSPELDTMSFKIRVDVQQGLNPRKEWEEWQDILIASTPYPFILGTKPLGKNKWLLVSVAPSDFIMDNKGNILSLNLDLKFDEHALASDTSSSSKQTTTAGIADEVAGKLGIDPNAILDDKETNKRDNPGMNGNK